MLKILGTSEHKAHLLSKEFKEKLIQICRELGKKYVVSLTSNYAHFKSSKYIFVDTEEEAKFLVEHFSGRSRIRVKYLPCL